MGLVVDDQSVTACHPQQFGHEIAVRAQHGVALFLASTQLPNNPHQARIATNCDLCESLDGNPRCVHRCPHEAAFRWDGGTLLGKVTGGG